MGRKAKPLDEKLWPKVDIRGEDECWPYRTAVERDFYGNISNGSKGRQISSHVAAYQLTYGPVPDGMVVRHTCDYKPCCNPAHLVLGTYKDNTQDAIERGRWTPGWERPPLEVCQRGHDDWYVPADGRRRCRICRNEKARQRKKRKKDLIESIVDD